MSRAVWARNFNDELRVRLEDGVVHRVRTMSKECGGRDAGDPFEAACDVLLIGCPTVDDQVTCLLCVAWEPAWFDAWPRGKPSPGTYPPTTTRSSFKP